MTCPEMVWNLDSPQPAPMPRVEPGRVDWFEGDLRKHIDCDGSGVILTNAVPTIRAEDDDGNLTLGAATVSGTRYTIRYTVAEGATQAMYAIEVVCTTSDARTIKPVHSLPVVPSMPLHA